MKLKMVSGIIFADKVDNQKNRAKRVFIQTKRDDTLQIIYAKQARQYTDDRTGKPILVFHDGYLYEFSQFGKEEANLRVRKFGNAPGAQRCYSAGI